MAFALDDLPILAYLSVLVNAGSVVGRAYPEVVADAFASIGVVLMVDQTRPSHLLLRSEAPMKVTNIAEAKASLSRLVQRVLEGEEVIIGKAGKPVAKLVPFDAERAPRDLGRGLWRGQVWMADDFDDLPEEVSRSFVADDEPAA